MVYVEEEQTVAQLQIWERAMAVYYSKACLPIEVTVIL